MDSDKVSRAAQLIGSARHAIALTGAGVSTPSGIPDFRSKGSGLWEQVDPMAVASVWGFMENPQGFYDWVKPLAQMILAAEPNPAHRSLADLESRGIIHSVITQNIDDLHQRAGSRRVLEVHGHLREATCIRCGTLLPARPMIEQFLVDGQVPRCPDCASVMKPNVVLFGEMLPYGIMYQAEEESKSCDLMLIAGSSLEVEPAADLPGIAKEHGAQLIIVNRSPTPIDGLAEIVLHEDVAVALPAISKLVVSC